MKISVEELASKEKMREVLKKASPVEFESIDFLDNGFWFVAVTHKVVYVSGPLSRSSVVEGVYNNDIGYLVVVEDETGEFSPYYFYLRCGDGNYDTTAQKVWMIRLDKAWTTFIRNVDLVFNKTVGIVEKLFGEEA